MDPSKDRAERTSNGGAVLTNEFMQEALRNLLPFGLSENKYEMEIKGPIIPVDMWQGRDQQLLKTCMKFNVQFKYPREGEPPDETKARREELQRKCKASRQRQKRLEMTPESRETLRARQAERMRIKRSLMSADERRIARQQQSQKMRLRRKNLSPLQLERSLARRAKIVRDARGKKRLQKLESEGNDAIKSAIAAGLDFNDLKSLQKLHDLNDDTTVEVVKVVLEEGLCKNCESKISEPKTANAAISSNNIKVFNFGHAPIDVVKKFREFCGYYNSLSEALLDLLEKERHLREKYRFMPDEATQTILAISTSQDYPDVLQTTIQALKEMTKNNKYFSVASTIEELLFSPITMNYNVSGTGNLTLSSTFNESSCSLYDESSGDSGNGNSALDAIELDCEIVKDTPDPGHVVSSHYFETNNIPES